MKNATLILAAVTALVLSSCTTCPFGYKNTPKGKVEHIVLVWLKRPGNAADRAALVAAAKRFQAEIKLIQHLSVGAALPSDRDIVDDSFDVGFIMRFANKADMTAYEKHPVHVSTVKQTLMPIAKKVLVYDIGCE
ncbi:Dabb family protein [Prosthecobacter sp.]|uniref:Dabb family protein n=1 Tax=Prosthecobacter sp. TaxID=1965333 RepID=UPI001D2B069B|nr:Dabb family protein [Prosthecobacter sp.]MCB1277575.1 Dabb family protein [Prosthecobacter sp.]